jgi:hypothetical protein
MAKVDCKHIDKKEKECKIKKGVGWRREYCCVAWLDEECDNKVSSKFKSKGY